MTDYKPSDVFLGAPPLVGTMEHSEVEHAAALLVRTCARHGDAWRDVPAKLVGQTIQADINEAIEPLFGMKDNPFFRPDYSKLIECGYAEWAGEEKGPIRFTDKGFEAMRRWVRPRSSES